MLSILKILKPNFTFREVHLMNLDLVCQERIYIIDETGVPLVPHTLHCSKRTGKDPLSDCWKESTNHHYEVWKCYRKCLPPFNIFTAKYFNILWTMDEIIATVMESEIKVGLIKTSYILGFKEHILVNAESQRPLH